MEDGKDFEFYLWKLCLGYNDAYKIQDRTVEILERVWYLWILV